MTSRLFSSITRGSIARAAARAPRVQTSYAPLNFGSGHIPTQHNRLFADQSSFDPNPNSNAKTIGQLILTSKRGPEVIQDPLLNKGTGFSLEERERLGLRGLVPPTVEKVPMAVQIKRERKRLSLLEDPLEKYLLLNSISERNKTLFYRLLKDYISEMAPIVYTPTVGRACQTFGSKFVKAQGMYFSALDKGHMSSMVYNWDTNDVRVIVVTDGSRILGLGDLGTNGMGIPIGKLHLYTAIGGIHPSQCLPVVLDLGTDNEELLRDEFYLGLRQKRVSGPEYFDLVHEFMTAVKERWPTALVQFEDFNNEHAEPLLMKYRGKQLCFNDDIQGTGAVALAACLGGLRAIGINDKNALSQQKIVILGAGSAGLGVANSILHGMIQQGLTPEQAAENFYLVDDKGLLTIDRKNSSPFQAKFLRRDNMKEGMSLLEVVSTVKPQMLIGLSGVPNLFTEDVVRQMASTCERPIIFPLSNPTSRAECSAEDAFTWTDGKAIVASGSPFEPVQLEDGRMCYPSQANNMWTFPAIGLGASTCQAEKVNRRMVYSVSEALAAQVSNAQLAKGMVFPEIEEIRDVTEKIAVRLCEVAYEDGIARAEIPHKYTIGQMVRENMWDPAYGDLVYRPEWG